MDCDVFFKNGMKINDCARSFAVEKINALKFLMTNDIFNMDRQTLQEILEITYSIGAVEGMRFENKKAEKDLELLRQKISRAAQ